MTDPIGAMLNMLKNAGNAGKPTITVPFSKIKFAIAECLKAQGYVESVSKKTKKNLPYLEVGVKFEGNAPRINEVARVSKPSRRMYMGVKDIKPMKHGKGMFVLSTPKGILRDKDARKEMVGGEVLFSIW
ncbi:MAG: 30S ribosomal protein S8 [Candidatus Pacebacteria bacterium]|nr:30S ribosomal protein S8 [Candidatus Paceibacterota bacterium]MBP9780670.1 30S ribosomal protein S8 [Candidatus Paceibacterota bacterium]MDQ5949658.1 small subunit ribosomal protein [Patescibacteria group bacterium]